ncbi:formate dehydrogenase subunit alpha [Caloramator proteoclasticus]|uniref:NAD-dependent formate dehydrogenase catalytic subunit n=1 Tax=Caloramator proteoclasticus DSM 10124 TaxID=1121262 RepID=A0A1M4WFU8_9CLOT|nr:formate dehydrogenase subunit alpha [Caloramator proteoclasticus]SHE80116.1 NAD-dependent formate dehydrogenase catalytic subunit [Caloramator proteoclasticus DSM 10124]
MINLTIDGVKISVEEGTTILEAARLLGKDIPTLCHDERLKPHGACRICVVEVEGAKSLLASCSTPVQEGMVVHTESKSVIEARKTVLELLISNHPLDCLTCEKAGDCKLQDYCYRYDIKEDKYGGEKIKYELDDSNEFYICDQNKCILCGKCVRVCNELQCTGAIGFAKRGFYTHIAVPFDRKLYESDCVSCGNCVAVCPVGALTVKKRDKYRAWEVKKVRTTCSYCGVGCQMYLLVKDDKVVGVEPCFSEPNKGLMCVKGRFAYNFINHRDRLKKPLIKKNGEFVEVEWDEALDYVASRLKKIKDEYGSDSIAGFASARCTNEDNYMFQKFMRAVIGTNNVDHCARLCHATTVTGLATTFGSGAMTNSIGELEKADCIFIIGSNTTETHPVTATYIKRAKLNGAKIIVADPREIELTKGADVFMQLKPGTNVALLNAMMNVIIEEGLEDKKFIEERCENFEELVEIVKQYTPEKVEEITGVKAELIKEAARLYAMSEKSSIVYSMGITQHSSGVEHVYSVANLAMLCGKIGKEGCGVNPLRGQNNVQGACDMGCLPDVFPGYQKVFVKENLEKFEGAWGVKLSDKVGLTVPEVFKAAHDGKVKALYIMGENPMVSDPDIKHVEEALNSLEFLVVQDIFLTDTAKLADVVLPAASFAEKDGTFTNSERRVQRVRRAINSVGEAREDWRIIKELMIRLGYECSLNSSKDVMEEISKLTPQYRGIDYERIEEKGLQWPVLDKNHSGTPILHVEKFARGKGLFKPAHYKAAAETPDSEYPLILTTGRVLYHYHTMTMTGKNEGLMNIVGEPFVEINPMNASKLGIKDGEMVEVTSRRGSVKVRAKVTERIEEDVVFMPFHFKEANTLTNTALDEVTKEPELKVCTVRINRL